MNIKNIIFLDVKTDVFQNMFSNATQLLWKV